MPYIRITACLTVEEEDARGVTEALLCQIDSFVVKSICVFDSDVRSKSVDVAGADELRREMFDES
jgi:hypothetical protein